MKNLIEDIEKALENTRKLYEQVYENTLVRSYYHGVIVAYEGILKSLEDKNIITAPKSILLSEIVERLKNNCSYDDVTIERFSTYTRVNGFMQHHLYSSEIALFDFNNEGKVGKPHTYFTFKWLYTLWIAGTEIIDDMEGDE